jgi:hypothetical protein
LPENSNPQVLDSNNNISNNSASEEVKNNYGVASAESDLATASNAEKKANENGSNASASANSNANNNISSSSSISGDGNSNPYANMNVKSSSPQFKEATGSNIAVHGRHLHHGPPPHHYAGFIQTTSPNATPAGSNAAAINAATTPASSTAATAYYNYYPYDMNQLQPYYNVHYIPSDYMPTSPYESIFYVSPNQIDYNMIGQGIQWANVPFSYSLKYPYSANTTPNASATNAATNSSGGTVAPALPPPPPTNLVQPFGIQPPSTALPNSSATNLGNELSPPNTLKSNNSSNKSYFKTYRSNIAKEKIRLNEIGADNYYLAEQPLIANGDIQSTSAIRKSNYKNTYTKRSFNSSNKFVSDQKENNDTRSHQRHQESTGHSNFQESKSKPTTSNNKQQAATVLVSSTETNPSDLSIRSTEPNAASTNASSISGMAKHPKRWSDLFENKNQSMVSASSHNTEDALTNDSTTAVCGSATIASSTANDIDYLDDSNNPRSLYAYNYDNSVNYAQNVNRQPFDLYNRFNGLSLSNQHTHAIVSASAVNAIAAENELALSNDSFENNTQFKLFIIKSYSKEDVVHSIKYNVWCSTQLGNQKLDKAFHECQNRKEMSVYLLFSVCGSSKFCGLAKMISKVDFESKCNIWTNDKWKGKFEIKWEFIKDVPHYKFKHIILENNENKPVTITRDAHEVTMPQATEVVNIFTSYPTKTTILDEDSSTTYPQPTPTSAVIDYAHQQQYFYDAFSRSPYFNFDFKNNLNDHPHNNYINNSYYKKHYQQQPFMKKFNNYFKSSQVNNHFGVHNQSTHHYNQSNEHSIDSNSNANGSAETNSTFKKHLIRKEHNNNEAKASATNAINMKSSNNVDE